MMQQIVRASASWSVPRVRHGADRRSVTFPLDAAVFVGKTSGEVHVQLSPEQYGTRVR